MFTFQWSVNNANPPYAKQSAQWAVFKKTTKQGDCLLTTKNVSDADCVQFFAPSEELALMPKEEELSSANFAEVTQCACDSADRGRFNTFP